MFAKRHSNYEVVVNNLDGHDRDDRKESLRKLKQPHVSANKQAKGSKQLFYAFNQEYSDLINSYEDQDKPLVLLDALIELGFFSKKSPNLRNMRTSSNNILMTGKELSHII